jgi:hypothetical protein
MASINLVSSEGKNRKVDTSFIQRSKFLKEKAAEDTIKLDINEATLDLVMNYLIEYKDKEPVPLPTILKSNDLKKEVKNSWDVEFIEKLSFEQVFHLINAGLLLELDHLHDLACARIAAFMKDKQIDEINKEFTIECQLTAEEAKTLGLEVDDK